MLKKFLEERQVAYELRNVARGGEAARQFLALGGRLPPLVVIDGVVVHGYQPDELETLLEHAGLM